jgi:hypothetical protein
MTREPDAGDWAWYSVEQAARLLGISTPTVRRRIREAASGEASWTLPDGSRVPVIYEPLTRPQGIHFTVRLPATLGTAPTAEPSEAEPSVEASPTPDSTAQPPADASAQASGASQALLELLLHQLAEREQERDRRLAERSETIGELRQRLVISEASREQAVQASAGVTAELRSRVAELEAQLRTEQDGRLVAEAALVALRASAPATPVSEPAEPPEATGARPAEPPEAAGWSWWRFFFRWD